MVEHVPWHERDAFWALTADSMFTARRRADAAAEVERVIALAGVAPGARVLDMPCGIGRHALEFARCGFTVTGVDRTRGYLDETRAQAASQGVDLELVQADMREFVRPGAYDLALNLFTSFGYFEDQEDDRRVCRNFARSLRPGGALVMDMAGKEVLARDFQERAWREEEGTLVLEEREVTRDWTWMRARWTLVRDGRRHEVFLEHRIYSAAELRALLLDCGFASVEAFGGLDGRPYDRHAARLVVVARS